MPARSVRLGHVAERDLVEVRLELLVGQAAASMGVSTAPGRDGVDGDPVLRVRARQPAGHRDDPALRRRVDDGAAEAARPPALRGEVDDPSAAALLAQDRRRPRG